MKLGALAAAAGIALPSGAEQQVTGFAIDNRKVAPGTVFGAFQGAAVNGEDFIPAAIAAGAVAVVARGEARVEGAVHIADANPRRAFALLAARFFTPVPETIVAVTGTNGKTSTVEMTRQIWRMAGERSASIGTLGVTTADESVSTGLTTPDIVTFLANMSGLAREGVTHVAYEASSHGLSQYRNEGLKVLAGAFTNLSRDHLDYHRDMEDYFAAKMRLLDEVVDPAGSAVIWMDDAWSARAAGHAAARGLALLGVGENADERGIRLVSRTPGQLGQVLEIEYAGAVRKVNLPLIGAYQAANALVSAGLVLATGGDPAQVFDALSRLQPVRGRLERAAALLRHRGGQGVGRIQRRHEVSNDISFAIDRAQDCVGWPCCGCSNARQQGLQRSCRYQPPEDRQRKQCQRCEVQCVQRRARLNSEEPIKPNAEYGEAEQLRDMKDPSGGAPGRGAIEPETGCVEAFGVYRRRDRPRFTPIHPHGATGD